MKNFFYVMLCMLVAFSLFSCAFNSTPTNCKTTTMYKASESYSEYTAKVISNLNLQEVNITEIPDVFFVEGNQLLNMTNEEYILLTKTFLEGKTIVIGKPTYETMMSFGLGLETAINMNEELKIKASINHNSPYEIVQNIMYSMLKIEEEDEPIQPTSMQKILYEAIGIRQQQIYFISDFNKDNTVQIDVDEGVLYELKDSEEFEESEDIKVEPDKGGKSIQDLINDSVQNFSQWVLDTNNESANHRYIDVEGQNYIKSRAINNNTGNTVLDELMNAQTLIKDFTVKFTVDDQKYYHEYYKDRAERVQVIMDVWTACDITNQKDYYIMRTSVTCNNQDLNCFMGWDKNNWGKGVRSIGPYFSKLNVYTSIYKNLQTVREDVCSPQTDQGSEKYTASTELDIGGNFGFSMTGPTIGLSGSNTFKHSTSYNIPDIDIVFNVSKNNRPDWVFTGHTPKGHYTWLLFRGINTYADDVKKILYNTASFITYSMFVIDSDAPSYKDKSQAEATAWVNVSLECLACKINDTERKLLNGTYTCTAGDRFDFMVNKPCNAVKNYVMFFNPPAELSISDRAILNGEMEKIIDNWNSNVPYYAVGEENLDKIAISYFKDAMNTVINNKLILQSKGFKGKFTFYIVDPNETDNEKNIIAQQEIDF